MSRKAPDETEREGHSDIVFAEGGGEQLPPIQKLNKPELVERKIESGFFDITRDRLLEAWEHTSGLVLALVSIWVVHWVLKRLFGPDGRFFDYLPLRFIIDAAELVVLVKLIWHLVIGFKRG